MVVTRRGFKLFIKSILQPYPLLLSTFKFSDFLMGAYSIKEGIQEYMDQLQNTQLSDLILANLPSREQHDVSSI